MRYSAYKRKKQGGLYILHEPCICENVYAISESKEILEQYKTQFKSYRDREDRAEITHVTDRYEVHQLYKNYYDTLFVEEFKKDIILTLQEVKYYSKLLMKIYDDMKTMIGQLLLNERLLHLTGREIELTHNTFDMYYGKCKSFQDFIELIDPEIFKKEYLIEPIVAKISNDMDDSFYYKMMDDEE